MSGHREVAGPGVSLWAVLSCVTGLVAIALLVGLGVATLPQPISPTTSRVAGHGAAAGAAMFPSEAGLRPLLEPPGAFEPDRVLPPSRAVALALRAARPEGEGVSLRALVLTTFGRLAREGVFGEGGVPSSRLVYLAVLDGSFTVHEALDGSPPVVSDHLNLAIDARSGDVLAAGASEVTDDPGVLQRVRVEDSPEAMK